MMNNFFSFQDRQQTKRATQDNNRQSSTDMSWMCEEVIRKQHETIKLVLNKIGQIYSRQEECELGLSFVNQKITDLSKNNANLHHEMRANHLDITTKQQTLTDEIRGIKNFLKIPGPGRSHQEYLSSNFFKEQSSLINNRGRARCRNRQNRYKTNHLVWAPEAQNQNVESNLQQKELCPNHSLSIIPAALMQQQKSVSKISIKEPSLSPSKIGLDHIETLQAKQVKQKIELLLDNFKMEIKLQNEQQEEKMAFITKQIQQKVAIVSDNSLQHSSYQFDLQELHNYLDRKVVHSITGFAKISYIESSLTNLKEAWQNELDQMYALINLKVSRDQLRPFEEKIKQLTLQVQAWNNLNSIKMQNMTSNSTCKSTPFRVHLQRASMERENKEVSIQQGEVSRPLKKHLKYCSSLSSLNRSHVQPKVNLQDISEHQWKQNVAETLGLQHKKVKRRKA